MKGWTKRRVALILALALMASQLAACKETTTSNAAPTATGSSAVAAGQETTPVQETQPEKDPNGWLEENLENIRKSLLAGDYAGALDILLEMREELADDADYNALLYIAYMGNGNKTEAEDLLKNDKLDKDAFTDAFLGFVENVKPEDKDSIKRELMDHMMTLAEEDPEAYASVAKIGANIQNADPSDPTAYAARYIAALASGDEAAAEAVLAEAKANGISAKDLSTAAIEYIEEVNLTNITVEQVEKGITTSTTYSQSGKVVKVVETVVNPDGSRTETAKDRQGNVYGVAKFDIFGNPVSREVYTYENVQTANGGIERKLTGVEKHTYSYGILTSIETSKVTEDGSMVKDTVITVDVQGNVTGVTDCATGEAWSKEKVDHTNIVLENGDLVSLTLPTVDENGNVDGTLTNNYAYHHPAGVRTGAEGRDLDGNLWYEDEGTFNYDTDDGTVEYVEANGTYYDKDGDVILTNKMDYAHKKYSEYWADGSYSEATTDESCKNLLTQNKYNADGTLASTYYCYYTGEQLTSELDVYYDEQGRVIEEQYFGEDREVNIENPKKVVSYQYEDGYTTIIKSEYDTNKQETSYEESTYYYDETGKTVAVNTYVENANGASELYSDYRYDENGNKIQSNHYEVWQGQLYIIGQDRHYYNEDGTESKIEYYDVIYGSYLVPREQTVFTYNENGQKTATTHYKQDSDTAIHTEYTYTKNGEVQSEAVYQMTQDGTKTQTSVKEYTYDENGNLTGYTTTPYDADGNAGEVTYFTPEGYAYQVEIKVNGQVMMLRLEDGELVIEEVPEETESTEPTEGEEATEPTEGEEATEPTEGEEVTEPTEGEEVTEPTEGEEVTEPTEGEEVTEPTEGEEVTEPTEGEEVTEPTEGEAPSETAE